jgi:hypothetical protein
MDIGGQLCLCNTVMHNLIERHLGVCDGKDNLRSAADVMSSSGVVVPLDAVASWRQTDAQFLADGRFNLHQKCLCTDHLRVLHPLERDARCVFHEVAHVYIIDGVTAVPWSVSRCSHLCMEPFCAGTVLDEYYSEQWACAKGYVSSTGSPLSRNAIESQWRDNGLIQSRRGTLMHWHIECILNGYALCEPHSPEIAMFWTFKREFLDVLGLVPYRTELSMFHCGMRLAGQADLICRDPQGSYVIIDWKRCRSIEYCGFQGKHQLPPLDHLHHCNFSAYSLQLNLYRHILESEYNLTISGMYLVVLHPDQWPHGPHVHEVAWMDYEIDVLRRYACDLYGVSSHSMPGAHAVFDVSQCTFDQLPVPH